MEKNSEPRLLIPVTVEGENSDLLEESIVKLFKVAFDIDIKTCTKKEWAERITIKGGTLKQWQSFIKLSQRGGVRNHE